MFALAAKEQNGLIGSVVTKADMVSDLVQPTTISYLDICISNKSGNVGMVTVWVVPNTKEYEEITIDTLEGLMVPALEIADGAYWERANIKVSERDKVVVHCDIDDVSVSIRAFAASVVR